MPLLLTAEKAFIPTPPFIDKETEAQNEQVVATNVYIADIVKIAHIC